VSIRPNVTCVAEPAGVRAGTIGGVPRQRCPCINRAHLRKLSGYPLLCALLCALHQDRRATLPSNRMELYEVALQMLLERRDVERKIDMVEGLGRTEKLLLLGDLAYWLIRNGYTDVEVPRALYRIAQRLHHMPQAKASNQNVYRHLLERSGLIREPVEGRVDFIHRTFQEYLAARDAMTTDDVGTVVQNAHLDQWHEVVVMAVGHASRKQREELLRGLLNRGDLQLLVLASLETAPELDADLRREIQVKTSRLLPPSSMNKAKTIASAGEYVIDLLAQCNPQTIDEIKFTIRALAETRLDEALPVLAGLASDPRDRVFEEVLRCMELFDVRDYGEAVLGNLSRKSLYVKDEVTLMAARYMRSLNKINLGHFLDREPPLALFGTLPQVSSLELGWWPEEDLHVIKTKFRLVELALNSMKLQSLHEFDFVESVAELRFENGWFDSLDGIERWRESLKKVSVVSVGSINRKVLNTVKDAMPHVIVSP
jgi:hypothetical protein